MNEIRLPTLRLEESDFSVDFEIEIKPAGNSGSNSSDRDHVKSELSQIDQKLSANDHEIKKLNQSIDNFTNKADGLDYTIAVASGILSGLIDSLWVGEFSFERGKAWSNKNVNDFVLKTARSKGYEGDRLDGAIAFLEKKFPVSHDNSWSGKDMGISAKSHHIDDLAHHPTPIGLFFSILSQFTKEGYFQNSEGKFLKFAIDEKGQLIGENFQSKIFAGTINWFFHLVSDMSGSNKTAGSGMGIPGPIVSLLKEASLIPGLNQSGLSKKIKEIFVDDKIDLRSELAFSHEITRQAVPIVLNELIVRSFYFIRKFISEYKEQKTFEAINWKNTLPWGNRTIARMLTISTGVFCTFDLLDAAIRGAVKSGGEPSMFAKEFVLRVNFVGMGRFSIAVATDVNMGIKKEYMHAEKIVLLTERLQLINAKVYYIQADTFIAAKSTAETINEALAATEKAGAFLFVSLKKNEESLEKIEEAREGIEEKNPDLLLKIANILK